MKLPLFSLVLVLVALFAAGCASTTQVKPMGEDTYEIVVEGTEAPSDTPDSLRDKLRALFQAKAQAITDGRKYERYELLTFETTRTENNTPIARGTIRCFR